MSTREPRFPGRRLSPVRLTLLLALIGAIGYSGILAMRTIDDTRTAEAQLPWFGAYIDATASPMYPFETPSGEEGTNVVLSFIVASDPKTCEASWGGYHTLDGAQSALELDRRIARLRQLGGEVVLSFGGEAGPDLSLVCDSDALATQYQKAVERYRPIAIDLDIEGEALADVESRQRRIEAIARLQDDTASPIPVWLTLPVGSEGLTAEGVKVVQEFLDAGVTVAGVNAMTMNYTNLAPDADLATMVTASLRATHRQLSAVYSDAGVHVGERSLWRRIGVTPMIGQNDVAEEVFTIEDARRVHDFASEVGIGRVSMWSANRDQSCGEAYADLRIVSESCSGVVQGEESFASILGAAFPGAPDGMKFDELETETIRDEDLIDDPDTSPYRIWEMHASYPEGTRVVWRRNVYVANWWSSGDRPDDPSVTQSANPWHLVGPVLDGEEPIPQLALPSDFYPDWDPARTYHQQDRVLFEGVAYEAKWWTSGDTPAAGSADPGSSPWRALSQEEIEGLLAGTNE